MAVFSQAQSWLSTGLLTNTRDGVKRSGSGAHACWAISRISNLLSISVFLNCVLHLAKVSV